MMAGMNIKIPIGSIRLTLLSVPGSVLTRAFESLKNMVMKRPVMTPNGMLM